MDKAEDTTIIAQQFLPAMMDPILSDYARSVPDARWASLHHLRDNSFKNVRSIWLMETCVGKAEDTTIIAQQILPAVMDPILSDYARNVPDARWASLHHLRHKIQKCQINMADGDVRGQGRGHHHHCAANPASCDGPHS